MKGKEYLITQIQLLELGKKVELLDLDSFLQCIANAETAGPIVDPTLYMKGMTNLRALKNLALAFKQVKEQMPVVRDAVIKTGIAQMVQKKGMEPQ